MMGLKLSEAIEKMNPGDYFEPNDENIGSFHLSNSGSLTFPDGQPIHFHSRHLNLIGEIIKAGPKVLSADDIGRRKFNNSDCDKRTSLKFAIECADEGIKNGQLKQWLNHEELIEAVENVLNQISQHDSVSDVAMGSLKNALKNIKPLDE